MEQITLDGLDFSLRAPFDFSFLEHYGQVFQVFDQQDSGNLCFGVDGPQGKRFLKLAGAPTQRSEHVDPAEAIDRLKRSLHVYEALHHPALLGVLEHKPVPGGYLAVFEWFDGTCMGKQYGQFQQFLALPTAQLLAIYQTILDFHVETQTRGYLAIDFYDGCILHDFATHTTRICDIEFYRKLPSTNDMGRLWGSSRYMSPEEFTLGASLDARTNVFTLGATAFQLFGGGTERQQNLWRLSDAAYSVAYRATQPDPTQRFETLAAYTQAWARARNLP